MATTKIWSIKNNLTYSLRYIHNPEKTDGSMFGYDISNALHYAAAPSKTEQCLFVSGINCEADPADAYQEMLSTKKRFGKTGSILAFHCEQSFKAKEATPEQAHEIGVKFAQEMWGDRFEVLVATHLNTDNTHNHFILNSVSYVDGLRYYDNKTTLRQIRQISDRLCREYSLSVVDNPKSKGKHYTEWKAEQDGKPTWRSLIRADVDTAITESMTFVQFIKILEQRGYEVDTSRKYLRIRPPTEMKEQTGGEYNGFFRVYNLGEEYSEEAIKRRILHQRFVKPPSKPAPVRVAYFKGTYCNTKKLTGIRALYFHYLYKMGILPKRKTPRPASFLYRQDLMKLNRISAEVRLLCRNKIDTVDQLRDYLSAQVNRAENLNDQRRNLYNQLRRCSDTQKNGIKQQIAEISPKINALRREVHLCKEIETRSVTMKERIAADVQSAAAKKEKEVKDLERRSRPNR